MTVTDLDAAELTVFFDGACRLCRSEIGLYQG
jgi:predicted DCC family thiol-disulfide oxidoreductase YuxK